MSGADGDQETLLSGFSGPEVIGAEVVSPSTTSASLGDGELMLQRDQGLQLMKERIQQDLANKQIPIEESDLILSQFTRQVDGRVRASFFDGIRAQEIDEGAVEPKVGLTFMAGPDTPQVNRMEQIGMSSGHPDQMSATWRVNTAGTLLRNFDVDKDLSILQTDNTAAVIAQVRARRARANGDFVRPASPRALVSHRRGDRTVTIDSENVEIVNDLNKGSYDLESTLIEVDGSSLTALIVNYRYLISRGGPVLNFEDTVQLLDMMIEDARRLCMRSPILFRMSTRRHIIAAKNTRYGIDHGTMFRTLTTSHGIKNIIELSSSYYNSLASPGGKDKNQEVVRPKFLQMLVLLLSLLNDDDLSQIGEFLEVTYNLKAERQHVELLILKVLPLMSINSKIFVNEMVVAFEGPHVNPDPRDHIHVWRVFIQRLLENQYILPGTVDQLGQFDYSWIIKWPDNGIRDSHIFNHLQYGGTARTINDIPPIELNFETTADELTAILTNNQKYIIGTADLEKITCMTKGRYSVTEAEGGGRAYDLEIREEVVNLTLYDAIHQMNSIIGDLNRYLATPRRQNVIERVASIRRSGLRSREGSTFAEIRGSGRLTFNMAWLNDQYLAAAYKVEGRKITRRDLVRIFAQDLGKITVTVQIVEQAMSDFDQLGVRGETRQHINVLRRALGKIKDRVAEAEEAKTRQDRPLDLPDEPVSRVLYPSGAGRTSTPVWHNYKAWYKASENALFIDAYRRTVSTHTWISDDIIQLEFGGVPARYFVSPLRALVEAERFDEIQDNDRVLLVGQYVVVVEPQPDTELEVVTNWLKITAVEQHAFSRRGANRRPLEAVSRAVLR